jgi:hypothetical protein
LAREGEEVKDKLSLGREKGEGSPPLKTVIQKRRGGSYD